MPTRCTATSACATYFRKGPPQYPMTSWYWVALLRFPDASYQVPARQRWCEAAVQRQLEHAPVLMLVVPVTRRAAWRLGLDFSESVLAHHGSATLIFMSLQRTGLHVYAGHTYACMHTILYGPGLHLYIQGCQQKHGPAHNTKGNHRCKKGPHTVHVEWCQQAWTCRTQRDSPQTAQCGDAGHHDAILDTHQGHAASPQAHVSSCQKNDEQPDTLLEQRLRMPQTPVLQARFISLMEVKTPPVRHDQHDLPNLGTSYCQQACRAHCFAVRLCYAVSEAYCLLSCCPHFSKDW